MQTMNILIAGQCVTDMSASFFTLLTAVIVVDGTHMSRDSIYNRCPLSRDSSWDLFVCYMWLTRVPLWFFLFTSTYGILLMTFDRYAAVIYPVWYSSKVSVVSVYAMGQRVNQVVLRRFSSSW